MSLARSQMLLALSLLLAGSAGCKRIHSLKAHRTSTAPRQLAPLKVAHSQQQLELEQFESSTVFVPVGTRFARPVVIAMHGQSDSPAANCNAWSTITESSYFVLCPALRRKASASDKPTEACAQWECAADELRAALVVLRKQFGPYIAPKHVILAGYERGAAWAVPIAQQDPNVFSIVWLIDGGLGAWSSALSTSYVDRGGKLLGVVCTNPGCQGDLTRVATSAHSAGLPVAEYHAERAERNFDAALATALKSTWETARPNRWPWVVPGTRSHAKN